MAGWEAGNRLRKRQAGWGQGGAGSMWGLALRILSHPSTTLLCATEPALCPLSRSCQVRRALCSQKGNAEPSTRTVSICVSLERKGPLPTAPPSRGSPDSRLLSGPDTAGPERGASEGPSASDSVVREPTSETSPSSPSVLCRRGLRCQFWMAWRRRPELRGGCTRSELPLAA